MTNMIQVTGSQSLAFEAFQTAPFLDHYDAQRLLVAVVEGILKKDSNQLATAMKAATNKDGVSLADLIVDIKSAANDLQSLGQLFECAAARIEAVEGEFV